MNTYCTTLVNYYGRIVWIEKSIFEKLVKICCSIQMNSYVHVYEYIWTNYAGFCRRSKVDVNQSYFVVAPGDVAFGPQPYATRIYYILPHNSHCKHSSINDILRSDSPLVQDYLTLYFVYFIFSIQLWVYDYLYRINIIPYGDFVYIIVLNIYFS